METIRKVIIAIEHYKQDIAQFPIFFRPDSIKYLETQLAIDNICAKYDDPNYIMHEPMYYTIPYDGISVRIAYDLDIDDIIIRYILTKSISSSISLYTNNIDCSSYSIYAQIDIYNFYPQVDSDIFISTIKREFGGKIDNKSLELLEKCLIYNKTPYTSTKGLLIGLKPDEYFAEIFISIIHAELNKSVSRDIIRNGDEFIIFGNSVGEIREIIGNVEYYLRPYKLSINKAKNKIEYIKEKRTTTRLLPFEQETLFISPSLSPPKSIEVLFQINNYIVTHNNSNLKRKDFESINTYEDSINYLKELSVDLEKVKEFNKKYPEYNLFASWNSSTPLEAEQMYERINWGVLIKPVTLDNLETIIYRFPRSQYYSAMAIHYVCVIATIFYYDYSLSTKNSENKIYEIDGIDFSQLNKENCTLLAEKANSILFNALKSRDIYDFQKYLILRELFFDKKTMTISKGNFRLKSNLPYPDLIMDSLKSIDDQNEMNGPFVVIKQAILSNT